MKNKNYDFWDVLIFGWLLLFIVIALQTCFRVGEFENALRKKHQQQNKSHNE
jgi:hypothetical protein